MNKFIPLAVLMLSSGIASAQQGIGTNAPHPSAVLELNSTTKGFLIPRMTEAQRLAIPNPAYGLLVYQTDNTGTSTAGLYANTSTTSTPNWAKTGSGVQNITGGSINNTPIGQATGGAAAGKFTTLEATGTTTLNGGTGGGVTISNLTIGNVNDSLLNITPAGVVYKVGPASIPNNIKADNGLNRVADSIELGGTLKMPTVITASATNTLAIGGLQSGTLADSLVVADRTTGVLRRLPTTAISNAINANNGLTRLGDSIQLGGNLTKASTVTTTATNTLAVGGLQSGSLADSIVVADRTTGVLRRLPTTAISNAINADNGLTRVGDSIELGGTLKMNTTIDQNDKQLQFTNVDRFAINNSTTLDSERFVVRADGSIAMGNAPAIYPSNKVEVDLQKVGDAAASPSGEQSQGVNVLASALSGSTQATALRARMNVNAGDNATTVRGLQGNVGIDGTLNGVAGAGYFSSVVRSGATLGAAATVTAASGDAESNTGATAGATTNNFVGARFGANATNSPNVNTFGMVGTAIGNTNAAGANTGMYALATNGAGTNTGIVAGVGSAATVGAAMNAAKANKNAAIVGVNRGTGDSSFAGYMVGNNSSNNGRVLAVRNDITATLASSAAPAATDADLTYNPASSTTGGIIGITTAAHAKATTIANDFQAQGALMEASATNGVGGQFHAVGGFGLGIGQTAGSTVDANAMVVGLSGGSAFPAPGAAWNGVGVDGFADFYFNGTSGRVAGGHFDGTNGGAATSFGMIGTVGGALYKTFFDASLANRQIGVAATNNNGPISDDDSSQLALYSSGAVQMIGLNGTGATENNAGYVLTVDKNGLVGKTGMLSGSAALDFGTVVIGAGATYDQTITVTGAQDGDVVSLGVPTSAITSQGIYTAFVSAADTITVRLTNTSGTTIPVASRSGTFKVKVVQ